VAPAVTKSVLIVDDNAFVRQALCEQFTREADFEICGEAENGKEAIYKAQELHPDLIVLDLCTPLC
jgi:chemotaxis response regulator CheB